MKPDIAVIFSFILLSYNIKFNPTLASKVDYWDQIDATKKNMSTFSIQCQDQMVKVESNIYHLDRLRASLKSAYFKKLFTSDDFKQKNDPILEIQTLNSEAFSAVVDLIHGKELSEVLNKDNYLPLLETMDHLGMEIDLKNFSNFMKQNLTSYSLQEAKIFEVYNFIRKNSKFEYLFESVFKHFANDLTTLQNHTIFLSLPLDHLIRIINKVEHPDDKKRYTIIRMCAEWLCHDMEKRLFQMANLVTSIKSAFHSLIETNTGISKCFPICNVDEQTKRKVILRCLFALLAGKNLDFRRLDEFKPEGNPKSLSPTDAKIFKYYNCFRKNSTLEHLLEGVFIHFANNLALLQNHKIFPSLPCDHLVQIIDNIQEPDDEKRYKIIQMFTEWLCHDMENRLPHLVKLVSSSKSLFHSSIETNINVRNCLPRCNVDEKLKRKIISKCLFALLIDGEQLNPNIFTDDESNYHTDDESNYHTDDEYYSEDDESKSNNPRKYKRFVNNIDENAKVKKFLNNSDFYDITVRVGEKTYKLHRVILESRCGYFKNIFRAEYAETITQWHGKPTCPSKDKEYLLNDQGNSSTFDAVIDYIYFGNFVEYDCWREMDEIVRIFVTVDTLEIQNGRLLEYCKEKLMDDYYHKKVNSKGMIQILNCTHGKTKHDDLYLLYLCKHMNTEWPNIYNMSLFCSISWTMLENILKSEYFNLNIIDSHKILDICSKWLSHDTKNRYHFIPQIVKIINPLCVIDHNKYTTLAATELNDCSQQWIQNKLLHEMLSSLPYIVHSKNATKNSSRRSEEIPVFVAVRNKETIDILDSNLDEIASLHFPGSNIPTELGFRRSPLSAAMIHDNLFIYCISWAATFFEVFNLSSKKHFSLAMDSRLMNPRQKILELVNCNNEIYCYSEKGWIMKYSMQMNSWMIISKQNESNKELLRITSDGETLYRIYEVLKTEYSGFVAEAYDFEKNLWNPIPDLPLIKNIFTHQLLLTVVNDRDLAVSSFPSVIISDRNSNKWNTIGIPNKIYSTDISVFTQCENRMLLVVRNELYQFSPSNPVTNWEFKKKLPLKNNCSETKFENLRYQSFSTVHRPRLCIR